jgi:general secretion pathway protein G
MKQQQKQTQTQRSRRNASRVQSVLTLAVFAGIIYAGVTYGPALVNGMHMSNVATAKSDLTRIGNALQSYRVDMGSYPSTDEGLAALLAAPRHDSNWHGPYLQQGISGDPWGHRYVYRGQNSSFDLLSYGADGEPGGQGDDQDISYFR